MGSEKDAGTSQWRVPAIGVPSSAGRNNSVSSTKSLSAESDLAGHLGVFSQPIDAITRKRTAKNDAEGHFVNTLEYQDGGQTGMALPNITSDNFASGEFSSALVSNPPKSTQWRNLEDHDLKSLHMSICDQELAQNYFLANYILLDSSVSQRGHLDFVLPLLTTAKELSPLRTAFSAVSMAALGTKTKSNQLLAKANLSYGLALKHVNATLADAKLAKGDAIMATIHILTTFEVIVSLDIAHCSDFVD